MGVSWNNRLTDLLNAKVNVTNGDSLIAPEAPDAPQVQRQRISLAESGELVSPWSASDISELVSEIFNEADVEQVSMFMAAILLLGGRHGAMGGEARSRKRQPFRPSMTSLNTSRGVGQPATAG